MHWGWYCNIVSCTTEKCHDIALDTGQYHIYCPGSTFDLRHRWDTRVVSPCAYRAILKLQVLPMQDNLRDN